MPILPCGWWPQQERPVGVGVTITFKLSKAQQQKARKQPHAQ
jgi:hypothetical protein